MSVVLDNEHSHPILCENMFDLTFKAIYSLLADKKASHSPFLGHFQHYRLPR